MAKTRPRGNKGDPAFIYFTIGKIAGQWFPNDQYDLYRFFSDKNQPQRCTPRDMVRYISVSPKSMAFEGFGLKKG